MNVLIFIFSFISAAYGSTLEDLKVESWHRHSPKVVICEGSRADISAVKFAMKSWENRGYTFSGLLSAECDKKPNKGEIAIYPAGYNDIAKSSAAETIVAVYNNVLVNGKEEISYARILVSPAYKDSKKLFEHELGHALGYHHDMTSYSNSIMAKHASIY